MNGYFFDDIKQRYALEIIILKMGGWRIFENALSNILYTSFSAGFTHIPELRWI